MWILFALTSAAILASRKIQEKKLVWDVWGALGWMIRLGSAMATGTIWMIFSRDITWVSDIRLWIIIGIIALIMYPLQIQLYFRAMQDLPLSLFGMLAWVAPLTSLLLSWWFLGLDMSIAGIVGIWSVVLAIGILFYRHEKWDIHINSLFIAIGSYILMGMWSVMDKLALSYANPYTYAFLNQATSALILFLTAYFFSQSGPRMDFFQKNKNIILLIGISQGISWVLWSFALAWAPNPGYTTALVNTHAILTTLYGVFILNETITRKKLSVFICMLVALISFAFA